MTLALEAARPRCAVFPVCGGCGLQDVEPNAQLAQKAETLRQHLRELANIEPGSYQMLPPVTGPHWNYRRKARLAVRMVRRKGGVLVGFRERRKNYVTDMHACEVLAPGLAELIRPLRVLLNGLAARETIPQIEAAVGETDAESFRPVVALVLRHLRPLAAADAMRLREFAAHWNLHLYLQPAGVDSVRRLYPDQGPDELYYHLPEFNLRMAFHPMDFLQVNAAVNRRAARLVTDLLALAPEDHVLDLFCGLGNFSLPLARGCASVTGVEGGKDMVARAEHNARANGLNNVSFFAADLQGWNLEAPWALRRYQKVLLDPPRSGALETIPLVKKVGARRLVYVSCNPKSFARDALELTRGGFI